jgi:transposase
LRAIIAEIGAEAVIPSNRTRKIAVPHDPIACKQRNRIERCFNRLKHFPRFAARCDRRTIRFTGFLFLAAARLWLR